jgi:hypothetical protein
MIAAGSMPKRYVQRPVGQAELQALTKLARAEEAAFFERNPHLVRPYRDRLIAVALCQGAALQYLRRGYGVNDFDVHFFYSQNPQKPRLTRASKRMHSAVGRFKNMPVDFLRTVVPARVKVARTAKPLAILEAFLQQTPTPNARHLAEKAVVGLMPKAMFGVIIWQPAGSD